MPEAVVRCCLIWKSTVVIHGVCDAAGVKHRSTEQETRQGVVQQMIDLIERVSVCLLSLNLCAFSNHLYCLCE